MYRLSAIALMLAACIGTTVALANGRQTSRRNLNDSTRLATDGAFRNGLYLGRFSAQHKLPRRPTIGRWSSLQDRSSFLAGYSRGYDRSLADSPAARGSDLFGEDE